MIINLINVEISQDNSKFATCGGDKVCFLLDVSSGKVLRRFQGHTQRVNAVQLNDESTVLFTGSYDKAAHIWDLRSHMRDPIQSLTDFTDSVTSIALSRSEIMTSCVDGKVRTYDIRMGRMLVDDFHDPVIFTRFSYDQRCALSTCLNGVLRLTEVGTGKLLQSYSGCVLSLLMCFVRRLLYDLNPDTSTTHTKLRLISPMMMPELLG